MNRWEDQYSQHPVHNTLEDIKEKLNCELKSTESEELEERRRLEKVILGFQDSLDQLDPEIAPINYLDSINNMLVQHVSNQVNQYFSNGSWGHLKAANDALNSNLYFLNILSSPVVKDDALKVVSQLEKLTSSFAKKLDEKIELSEETIDGLEKEADALKERITELNEDIKRRKQEVDNQLSQWQQQFSEAQEQRLNEFNVKQKQIDNQFKNWDALFNDDQEARATAYDKWRMQTEVEMTEKINVLEKNAKDKIEHIFNDAKAKHKAILELYELAAGDSVAGGYLKTANNEKEAADIWRNGSVGFIIATVLWLLFPIFGNFTITETGNIIWPKVAMAFSLTGVLLFGAAYSAQQSTRHRNNEKKTRWFAMEVKAIDPFISSLPDEQQQELKKKLSDRLFAQATHTNEDGERVIDEHAFNVVVKSLISLLKNIPKT